MRLNVGNDAALRAIVKEQGYRSVLLGLITILNENGPAPDESNPQTDERSEYINATGREYLARKLDELHDAVSHYAFTADTPN